MLELALLQGSGDGVVSCLLPLKLVWAYQLQHRWYRHWLGCRYHLQSDQASIPSYSHTHTLALTRDNTWSFCLWVIWIRVRSLRETFHSAREILNCRHWLWQVEIAKVSIAAAEWNEFWVHPGAARPGLAEHVFLVVAFLCQKTVDIY